MRWFKHMAGASRDAFIVDLEARFGLEGYARWWKLLEVVAEQCRPERGEWTVTYPEATWARLLSAKRKVLRTFLEYCRNVSRIKAEYSGDIITIEICNMQKIKDNHARNLQATCKRLASKDLEGEKDNTTPPSPPAGGGAPVDAPPVEEVKPEPKPEQEPQPEQKPKRERKKPSLEFPPELQELWEACHPRMRECGRLAALNRYKREKKDGTLPEHGVLLAALERYSAEKAAEPDPFVFYFTRWLRDGAWDTGKDIEQEQGRRQVEEGRRAAEKREREQAAEEDRAQAIERWWSDQWAKLPEEVKEKWRAHACERNTMLAQARERGQELMAEIGGRAAWRRYQEDKRREQQEGGAVAQGAG